MAIKGVILVIKRDRDILESLEIHYPYSCVTSLIINLNKSQHLFLCVDNILYDGCSESSHEQDFKSSKQKPLSLLIC